MLTPNNNGDGNPFTFLGGQQYCATLTGTPDTTGFFFASMDVVGYAFLGSPSLSSKNLFRLKVITLTILVWVAQMKQLAITTLLLAKTMGLVLSLTHWRYPADPCDDGNENTTMDVYGDDCGCAGVCNNDADEDGVLRRR